MTSGLHDCEVSGHLFQDGWCTECDFPGPAAETLSLEHLRHFEVGYDREYIGVGLHCLVCPPGDHGSHWVDGAYLDWKPLTEAAELAMRHLREHHPELVEAS